MNNRMRCLVLPLALTATAAVHLQLSSAADHTVGGSIWTIPPTNDFYANWSLNQSFVAGDTLVFRFETGFYDVVEVSKREFDGCSADNPFQTLREGPAVVRLNEEGVFYFICSYGNYCRLGQKVAVSVERLH